MMTRSLGPLLRAMTPLNPQVSCLPPRIILTVHYQLTTTPKATLHKVRVVDHRDSKHLPLLITPRNVPLRMRRVVMPNVVRSYRRNLVIVSLRKAACLSFLFGELFLYLFLYMFLI